MKRTIEWQNESAILKWFSTVADKIIKILSAAERVPGKAPEIAVVVLYAVLHLLMAIVHEPWFDEAQAWQIARSASLQEILFEIPHYEGHPQLWHLVLFPFAKLGAPYELSLSVVTLLVAGTAIALLVFYAPFPRLVKWLLPFTYFLFYQYGIVARPYCLMILGFVLLAMTYRKRQKSPGKYVGSLFFMCLTSAYGIVIAGGLAFVWLIEILRERTHFFKDKRIRWLAGLLLATVLVMLTLIPRADTYAMYSPLQWKETNTFLDRMYYMLFISLPDVLITNVYSNYSFLRNLHFSWSEGLSACLLGILLHVYIIKYGKKKKTMWTFYAPFVLFSCAASVIYCTSHHIGIVQLLFFFWWWISLDASEGKDGEERETEAGWMWKKVPALLGSCMMIVMLLWCVTAVVSDVKTDFSIGRNLAQFIKEHHLDDYKIMAEWNCLFDDDSKLVAADTNLCYAACDIAPYFEHNILYNFGEGKDEKNYLSHVIPTEAENESKYKSWREQGYPDVLLMNPDISLVWEAEELNYRDYVMVYFADAQMPWKISLNEETAVIYVRKDLLGELGLEAAK